jgi:hypothetical protein
MYCPNIQTLITAVRGSAENIKHELQLANIRILGLTFHKGARNCGSLSETGFIIAGHELAPVIKATVKF